MLYCIYYTFFNFFYFFLFISFCILFCSKEHCILHDGNFSLVYLLYCIYSNMQFKFICSFSSSLFLFYAYMCVINHMHISLFIALIALLSIINAIIPSYVQLDFQRFSFYHSYIYNYYYILLKYITQIQYITFEMDFTIM